MKTETDRSSITPLFGSHLKDIILDEARSKYACLCPELAVPNQILLLMSTIEENIDSVDLFRQRSPVAQVDELIRSMELEKPVLPPVGIASVTIVLTRWLSQLPEPLLGFNHYDAIMACREIEDEAHRSRNLSILVREIPWYSRPLTLRLLSLLRKCIEPDHSEQNSLNIVAVSLLSTPWLLRPRSKPSFFPPTPAEREQELLAISAAGCAMAEFLITHFEEIFEPLKLEIKVLEESLTSKVETIRNLQRNLTQRVDIAEKVALLDDGVCATVTALWSSLSSSDSRISTNRDFQSEIVTDVVPPLAGESNVLNDSRWERCGLAPNRIPLSGFNVDGGLLSLECFNSFLQR